MGFESNFKGQDSRDHMVALVDGTLVLNVCPGSRHSKMSTLPSYSVEEKAKQKQILNKKPLTNHSLQRAASRGSEYTIGKKR